MKLYLPVGLPAGRPLVVVLHGCGQSAARFAQDAGWIALADRLKLALLLPEQTAANNRGRCFSWFRPQDVQRAGGEAASIRQMVRKTVALLESDRKQIFVAGFSAGGGMAAALLGAFPALFAAGAVVAGMPVGCASSPVTALMRMRKADPFRSPEGLGRDVLRATGSPARKSWPRLSIWQGDLDRTVDPGNAEILAAQWCQLHGLGPIPVADAVTALARRRQWARAAGKAAALEVWTLPAVGHGFPIDRRDGGRAARWISDIGLSATHHIADFWGLTQP